MGYLEVTIPPDILNEEPDDHVATEGGNVRLKCRATGIPEPRVSWKREDLKNVVLRQEAGLKEGSISNLFVIIYEMRLGKQR